MPKPCSMDLRERAMARRAAGESVRAIASALSVAPSTVVKWSQRQTATGSVAPGQMGGHKPRRLSGDNAIWLRERSAPRPFARRGLVEDLAQRGLSVNIRAVWSFVHREGLRFKKDPHSR